MIIGITGQKGVGKSTAAFFLKQELDNAYIVSFAKPVKLLVNKLVYDTLWLYHNSESIAEIELRHAQDNKDEVIPGIGASYRKLCQEFTKAGQAVNTMLWDNIGFDQCNKLLAAGYKYVIIDDVRYESTATILRQSGFKVLHIIDATGMVNNDKDVSEQQLIAMSSDQVLFNNKTEMFFSSLKNYADCLMDARQ